MRMPVSDRRYQLHLLKKEKTAMSDSDEGGVQTISKSGGKTTKRISGDALVNMIKSGQIKQEPI